MGKIAYVSLHFICIVMCSSTLENIYTFPSICFEGESVAEAVVKPVRVPQVSLRSKPSGVSPCSRGPCYPGVQCFESIHVSAGFVCGPCPAGLHGNGQKCTSAGESGAIYAP